MTVSLALRDKEISVPLEDETYPLLAMRMKVLTDVQAADLMAQGMTIQADDDDDDTAVDIQMPVGEMVRMFANQFIAFEGDEVEVDGVPFDVKDQAHVAALSLPWKIKSVGRLIAYATTLPEEVAKNSPAQVGP